MASDRVVTITPQEMTSEEVLEVAGPYQKFMKEKAIPSWHGCKEITFSFELLTGSDSPGYLIKVNSNRQLSDASLRDLRQLTIGFLAGWKARKA